MSDDEKWMQAALEQALQAQALGEVPVGAVLVGAGGVIGSGYNRPIATSDPTAHAEICALRTAAQAAENYRLPGTTLYVTLEPCAMCLGALIHARVERLVFGAAEPRAGAVCSTLSLLDYGHFNHSVIWQGGVLAEQSASLLRNFFRAKRASSLAINPGGVDAG